MSPLNRQPGISTPETIVQHLGAALVHARIIERVHTCPAEGAPALLSMQRCLGLSESAIMDLSCTACLIRQTMHQ